MSNVDLVCPECNQPKLVDHYDGTLQCANCQATFAHPDRLCPRCQAISELDDLDCPACGEPLRGLCPLCNTPNVVRAQTCQRCGATLDLMASVVERIGKTSAEVMYQRGRAAGATKRKEELQSDQRLAQMWERDNLREARLAQARAQQAQKDKQLANIIVAILALVIVGSVILFILAQWGG